MKNKDKDTTHASFDVPDDQAGAVMRYISSIKGVMNVSFQPNGRKAVQGEKLSRMTESTRRDVVLSLFKGSRPIARPEIQEALRTAGYSHLTINDVMKPLIEEKVIKRLKRGSYVSLKKAV